MANLALTPEGAAAIVTFANSMNVALENSQTALDNLQRVFDQNYEQLGVHQEDYAQMIQTAKTSCKDAGGAVTLLAFELRKVAMKMWDYINNNPSIDNAGERFSSAVQSCYNNLGTTLGCGPLSSETSTKILRSIQTDVRYLQGDADSGDATPSRFPGNSTTTSGDQIQLNTDEPKVKTKTR